MGYLINPRPGSQRGSGRAKEQLPGPRPRPLAPRPSQASDSPPLRGPQTLRSHTEGRGAGLSRADARLPHTPHAEAGGSILAPLSPKAALVQPQLPPLPSGPHTRACAPSQAQTCRGCCLRASAGLSAGPGDPAICEGGWGACPSPWAVSADTPGSVSWSSCPRAASS